MTDYEPGDLLYVRMDSGEDGYVFIESVARDGDLYPKFAREVLRDDDVHRLVERTGDPNLTKEAVLELAEADAEA